MRVAATGAGGPPVAGRRPPGAGRPPVPLHRLAADRRGRACPSIRPIGPATTPTRRPGPAGRAGGSAPRSGSARHRRGDGGFADDPAPADALVADPRRRRRLARRDDADRGPAAVPARCQGRRTTAAARRGRVDVARRGLGAAPCRPRGSSPATSSPTRRGARRAASRRRRWPTAGRSAARSPARWPPSPAAWPTSTAGRCACCTPARTSCGSGRSARRSLPASAPTARASSASSRTPGIAAAIAAVAPGSPSRRSTCAGPPTSAALRGAGWAEAAVLLAVARRRPDTVTSPDGATATASIDDAGVHVTRALRRAARRGRAAQLLHRRRPHGARLGAQRRASPSTTPARRST